MIHFKEFLTEKQNQFNPESEFKGRSVGIISASRGDLSPEENENRTSSLYNDLKKAGHHIVKAQGCYIENFGKPNAKEVGENVFITMHSHKGDDKGKVFNSLNQLGKKYGQDCIIHKPHNSDTASLIGTNESGYPGMGQRIPQGSLKMQKGEFYTKLSDGRHFSFM